MFAKFLVLISLGSASLAMAQTDPDAPITLNAETDSGALYNALNAAGVPKQSEQGSVALQVTDAQCTEHKGYNYEPVRASTYNCTLTSAVTKAAITLNAKNSKTLYLLLEKIGLQSDCGMGSCSIPMTGMYALRAMRDGKPYFIGSVTTDNRHVTGSPSPTDVAIKAACKTQAEKAAMAIGLLNNPEYKNTVASAQFIARTEGGSGFTQTWDISLIKKPDMNSVATYRVDLGENDDGTCSVWNLRFSSAN